MSRGKRFNILGSGQRNSLHSTGSNASSNTQDSNTQNLMLYLLQYESGIAYFVRNECGDEQFSKFEIWIGHIKASNLRRINSNVHGDEVNFFHQLAKDAETDVECLQIVDISERMQFHLMVRSRDDFGNNAHFDQSNSPGQRQTRDIVVKLEELNSELTNDEIDVSTCIVGAVYDWTFRLKDGKSTGQKEVLCKLKLEKNLTSGVEGSEKVTWRFKIAPGQTVTRTLYLLDIAASVGFDCRIAVKDCP